MLKNNRTLNNKYSKEIKLILCCARTTISKEIEKKIRALLHHNLDWNFILNVAIKNNIISSLYINLEDVEPNLVPLSVLRELKKQYIKITFNNVLRLNRLIEISDLLSSRGIKTAAIKGPVIAEQLYGDITYRYFSDIDILISKEYVKEAEKVIIDSGYRLTREFSDTKEDKYKKIHLHEEFIHQEDGTVLELHWALTRWHYLQPLQTDYLINRAKPIKLSTGTVLTLDPEDLFMVLCLHGGRHRWQMLKWICDIAEFINVYPEFDWDHLLLRGKKLGMRRMVYLGLFLAFDLLDATLPSDIVSQINSDRYVHKLSVNVQKRLFGEKNRSSLFNKNSIFQLFLKDRFSDKLRYAARSLFVPSNEDWISHDFSSHLSSLYYVTRPIRMIFKNLRKSPRLT